MVHIATEDEILFSQIRLTSDYILIKPIEKNEEIRNGIVIQGGDKKIGEGRLVLVGPGKMTQDGHILPTNLKQGEFVFYNLLAETPFSINGDDFVLMSAGDVIAVKKEKTNF